MSEEDEKKEAAIYRMDTLPPPEGEGDAYNAPTKVGPMAESVVKEMMFAAGRKAAELSERAAEKAKTAPNSGRPAAATEISSNRPTALAGSLAPVEKAVEKAAAPKAAPSVEPPVPPTTPIKPRPAVAAVQAAAKPVAETPSSAPPDPMLEDADVVEDIEVPVPRLYDDEDDYAATQLHAKAKPPKQEHTELIPAAIVKAVVANAKPLVARTPIPYAPTAMPGPNRGSFSLIPLAVGFTIFFLGLFLYLLAR